MIWKSFFIFLSSAGMLLSIQDKENKSMHADKLSLIINMENHQALPRNFRMTKEPYVPERLLMQKNPFTPPTYGLSKLRASASGQFSQKSLAKILEIVPTEKILLIDLREESHGFVNGIAISWYGENDWGNKNKSLEEILLDEKMRLQKTVDQYINLYRKDMEMHDHLVIHVKEAYSEADLAQKMGIHYVRIPVTDHLKPKDKDVDHFVDLIKTQVVNNEISDYWIHLHCSAGRGRATTFISMYDMMRNAVNVSFGDILARQVMIGGKDLAEPFDISDWRYYHHFERLKFLSDFYNYCIENPNFEQSWSTWISTHT